MIETLFSLITDPAVWASFITLVALEIVLGVDNLIIISILSDKLPAQQRPMARRLGLGIALVSRLLLLSVLFWIVHLKDPILTVMGQELSWSDIILIIGGLFLMAKGTMEIHEKIEGSGYIGDETVKHAAFSMVVGQIVMMDIIFSFDSILTAVGIAEHIEVMIAAILISVVFMVLAVNVVSDFVSRHPTVKVLALSYMLLIGMALVGEGMGMHIPKGYLYFAMAFSFGIEMVNMIIRKKSGKTGQY